MIRRADVATILSAAAVTCGVPAAGLAADAAISGHIQVGWRDVQVDGDEAKYDQYLNLDDGARLLDFALVVEPDSAGPAPDRIELGASGLGGDPYERLRLKVTERGRYAFRYDRQRSDYLYNDLLIRPEDASVLKSTGGDFHHFDFERVRDSARLDVDVTARASVTFAFDRYEKTGDSTTVLDVEREEFELEQPIDEVHEVVSLGARYSWDRVTVALTERWLEYDNEVGALLPGFSAGSSGPSELDFFFLDQPYRFDAREHQIAIRARPTPRWDLKLDVLDTDLELDLDAAERSQGLTFTGAPFARDVSGGGDIDRQTTLVELGAAVALTDRVELTAGYHDRRLDQGGLLLFAGEGSDSDWKLDTHGWEVGVAIALTQTLHLAGAWSTEQRDSRFVQSFEGNVDQTDVGTERDGVSLELSYRPNKLLDLSLAAEDDSIDDPYTLASPTDVRRLRARARLRMDNGLGLTLVHRRTDHDNDNTSWRSDSKQTEARLSYASERLNLSLGISEIDLERRIDQLVIGGFRQDLFAIAYDAEASFWDAAVTWRFNERVDFHASYRDYDNDGSFAVAREDSRSGLQFALGDGYQLGLDYRRTDYAEGGLEEFDSDIWELSLKVAW